MADTPTPDYDPSLPWWVIDAGDASSTTDTIASVWIWGVGVFLVIGVVALLWSEAGDRARGMRPAEFGEWALALICTTFAAVIWPVSLAVLPFVGIFRLFVNVRRTRVEREKEALARAKDCTAEALEHRARAVRRQIDERLAEIDGDPDYIVEAMRLQMARDGL
jgi:hypothetical protein